MRTSFTFVNPNMFIEKEDLPLLNPDLKVRNTVRNMGAVLSLT